MLPVITRDFEFPNVQDIINEQIEFIDSEAQFDFENACLKYDSNGDVIYALDGVDNFGNINIRERAIITYIEKIFRTEINCFKIYEKDPDNIEEYGSKFHLFIGFVFPYNYIKPLFSQEFRRCIFRLDEIEDVMNEEVEISGINGTTVKTSGILTRYVENSISVSQEVINEN
jgi:hypothetical protein